MWTERQTETRPESGESYQVCNDFVKELGTFLHLILGSPQLDNVTLLWRVGEIDNDLNASEIIKSQTELDLNQNKLQ